jgi:prepilin-type N-terminal cleavage/methylation domain-containing protein
MILEYLRWLKFLAADKKAGEFDETGPEKTKGFTLIELVVACTLLLLFSTIATTSTYNFVQATANLKGQYTNIQNIMVLHGVLTRAKMNYATDLAFQLAVPANQGEAQNEITNVWNNWAQQNDSAGLINRLINPDPNLPIPLSRLNPPPSRSYLPASRNVPVTTMVNGNPVTTYVLVQITDINSLLKAYQLTDDGTPTGNIVATISVGPILDVANGVRPTLPIIDWKSGTPQEIQF